MKGNLGVKGLVVAAAAWVLAAGTVGAQAGLPGDANGDCQVDGVDFVVVFNHYGQTVSGGASVGDFSGDGQVDGVDFVILLNHYGQVCQGTPVPTATRTPTPTIGGPTPTIPVPVGGGIWISSSRLAQLPSSGSAWNNVYSASQGSAGTPDLSNQDDPANVKVMAKALVYARIGGSNYLNDVKAALSYIANSGAYNGRALALGRELGAYVVAADLINLKNDDPALDTKFRSKIRELLRTPTSGGPSNLVNCHEERANNWGTMCGWSRAAVAAYLGDNAELARAAQVFRGWVGDRASYAGFSYGDLSWQCNSSAPVGINPLGCTKQGFNIDGVLPDDQRRSSGFTTSPPCANYVWGALGGAMAQAIVYYQAGYDVWNWENQALLRTHIWLHSASVKSTNWCAASGDNEWEPNIVNYYYGKSFPAGGSPGKNAGWTDWTHSR